MGVKGFRKIIDAFAKSCIEEKEFKDYRGKSESLDLPLIVHKFCIAISGSENYKTESGIIIGHLFAVFFKICSMLRYGIKPIPVFDGKPPEIKMPTLIDRKSVKEKASMRLTEVNLNKNEKNKLEKRTFTISSSQIKEMKYLLGLMGIQYLEAPGEAEAQCAALDIANICDGVVTEDWDAILFGCNKMLKDFSNKTKVVEIDREKLLQSLSMTGEQLIDLGIILGTDYCHGIGNIKPIDAYNKFKMANYDMNSFLDNLIKENYSRAINCKYKIPDSFIKNWKNAKEYYLHAPVVEPSELNLQWKRPNFSKLYEYLVIEKNFKGQIIKDKIKELKLMYKFYIKNKNMLVTLSRIKKELNFDNYETITMKNDLDNNLKKGKLNTLQPKIVNYNSKTNKKIIMNLVNYFNKTQNTILVQI